MLFIVSDQTVFHLVALYCPLLSGWDEAGMKANLECEHFNNIETSTFRFTFEDDQFSDITLVCEDPQQIRVHKVILSCVSEFILRNSHPKPVIYLRA